MAPQRNEKGQFVKGHSGGPGRPRRRTEEQYLNATVGSVTLKDWKEIVLRAVMDAKRGDHQARKWLSDYLLGTPVQRLEHGGDGGGPVLLEVVYTNRDNRTPDTT